MSIRIITDSASDIEQNELANVEVLPLTVTIDGVSYRDGIDMSKEDFFRLLENSETMPVTSLISPHDFTKAYKKVEEAGDEAIVLTLSSGLSGTAQSAMIAAEDFDCISVFDTQAVTAVQKLMVVRCQQLIDQGLSRADILKILEKDHARLQVFAVVDTLKYLVKGGRVSKGSGIVGGVIGIKPLLTLEGGVLVSAGKARGIKQSHVFLTKKIKEVGEIDFSMPFAVGYSGSDRSNLDAYIEHNKNLLPADIEHLDIVQIGSAVGTHAGPGAVLVTFFSKEA